ncbi:hypothetical protein [Streptomyces radiopugnans]|uniref:hypothetical protein n=1 Tax=Streptomyces radiopugnans TaxID=403935 RepID=UPI003F1B1CFA
MRHASGGGGRKPDDRTGPPPLRTLDDLAAEQGVAPLTSVRELAAGDIDGAEDLLAAISEIRGDGR